MCYWQIPDTTSLDQNISHGALLSVAEISLALTECSAKDTALLDVWQTSSKDLRQVNNMFLEHISSERNYFAATKLAWRFNITLPSAHIEYR
jgi:hypothetical protein